MPILANVNTVIASRGSYSSEAATYFARASVTDSTARRDIDSFIKQLKAASLWSSLVECWILRSAYNAGAGNTVFGLKGISDGTRGNSPAWGTDGMTFATTTAANRHRRIDCPWTGLYDIRSNSSVVCVSNHGDQAVNNFDQYLIGSNNVNGTYAGTNNRDGANPNEVSIKGPINAGNVNYTSVYPVTLAAGTYRMWTTQRENNLVGNSNVQGNKHIQDTTQIANGSNAAQVGFETIATATTTLIIGNQKTATSMAPVGIISFAAVFSDWSISASTLRPILKNTILAGVLP